MVLSKVKEYLNSFYMLFYISIFSRRKIVFKLNSAPKKHKEKVLSIQKQVREYQSRGDGKGMCAVSPAQEAQEASAKVHPVKLNLVDILDIDTERRVVRCSVVTNSTQINLKIRYTDHQKPICFSAWLLRKSKKN